MTLETNHQKTIRLSFNEYAVPVKEAQSGVQVKLDCRVLVQRRIDTESPVGGGNEITTFSDSFLKSVPDRSQNLNAIFRGACGSCFTEY